MNAEMKVHVPTTAQILREVLSAGVLLDTDFRTTEYLVKVRTYYLLVFSIPTKCF